MIKLGLSIDDGEAAVVRLIWLPAPAVWIFISGSVLSLVAAVPLWPQDRGP